MSRVTDAVEALARPIVEEEGCSLWAVEYVREAGTWFLRVFIDKDGGVDIADCERISRRLDPVLDEADPIPDSYVFEVGSAGIERELKRPSDFEQFIGAEVVSVTMFEDGKSCRVVVPDSQLSLAIGKEGQNARLAAKLTGFKIDIRPESEVQ